MIESVMYRMLIPKSILYPQIEYEFKKQIINILYETCLTHFLGTDLLHLFQKRLRKHFEYIIFIIYSTFSYMEETTLIRALSAGSQMVLNTLKIYYYFPPRDFSKSMIKEKNES